MTHIIIKNIGPIKEVELDLNKINVFMGPQSSGKSTIAKIISYCSWYEKNAILGTRPNIDFYEELLEFHNLEDSYFCDDSLIEYKSTNCHIVFSGRKDAPVSVKINVGPKNIFRNEKIEYIPAERNIVSLSGIGKYNDAENNILGFLYDWFKAKQFINKEETYILPLHSLNNIKYYYTQDDDADRVTLEDGRDIKLQHASSGLMSVTPLLVVFNYVVKEIYKTTRTLSPFEIINLESKVGSYDGEIKQLLSDAINYVKETQVLIEKSRTILKSMENNIEFSDRIVKYSEEIKSNEERMLDNQKSMVKNIGFDSDYNYSKIIIEEPELNLFPEAQRDLVYYMLESLAKDKKKHQLVITTHSPYILFALNNCMMGGLVKGNIPQKERKYFSSYKSWISPKKVSIYEIHDGTLKCIQDEDGIIEDNYLNQAYKDNSSEYMSLLNYYDDEE